MKPLVFVAAQFFLLSLSFAVLFDPIGISYLMLGAVWILSHKLAYFESILIFLGRGGYGWSLTAQGFTPVFQASPLTSVILLALPVYILISGLLGSMFSAKLSGSIIRHQIRKKAPDILGMIGK